MPTPKDVKKIVGDLPNMSYRRGVTMSSFIERHQIGNVLELGFNRGVSTCYIAAALEERGQGHVVTVDWRKQVRSRPGAEELLGRLGVLHRATLFYEYSSFNWRLYRFFSQQPRPQFDLVFLDGGHTWEVTGFAFLISVQLVTPGGWLIFDDLDWSFANSGTLSGEMIRQGMPEDERTTTQVGEVFERLVRPHPSIVSAEEDGRWGYARKDPAAAAVSDDPEEGLRLACEPAAATRRAAEEQMARG